jgi:hypothetical protein
LPHTIKEPSRLGNTQALLALSLTSASTAARESATTTRAALSSACYFSLRKHISE